MPIPVSRPTDPTTPPRRPAAFVDRDGVINAELDYVHRIADFHVLPGVVEGLRDEDDFLPADATAHADHRSADLQAAARWICARPIAGG